MIKRERVRGAYQTFFVCFLLLLYFSFFIGGVKKLSAKFICGGAFAFAIAAPLFT